MTGTTRNLTDPDDTPDWIAAYEEDLALLAVYGDDPNPSPDVVLARRRVDALSAPERELLVATVMGIDPSRVRDAYGTPRRTRDNGPTVLYRHFAADGTLLYVGIAVDEKARWRLHRRESPWACFVARVEREVMPTRDAAEAAEREAVRAERPIYNTRLSRDVATRDRRIQEFEGRALGLL